MNDRPRIAYRPASPEDARRVAAIDDSFTTGTVFEVEAGPDGFALRPVAAEPPLVKVFPTEDHDEDHDEDPTSSHVEVATHDGEVCGFVAVRVEEWHSRLVVDQITVAPAYRGLGVGSALMERACAHGRRLGARTAWLEASNVNVPAVRAYRRMGFRLCGLDTTFYVGTASEGEIALFMAKDL
uniref:GNAT family N-acetyltransferase n=1 Tax=Nonomuraea pusilla TaxID=46177 RepID=UPI0006E12EB1|nr:GNAT family N-acetyltransferase [Nonomuraea pusilla]